MEKWFTTIQKKREDIKKLESKKVRKTYRIRPNRKLST